MKRKIIQLAVGESEDSSSQYALCDDGTVWFYVWGKPIYRDVPATPERNWSSRERIGEEPATWKRMADIPQDE
jgi:hypothetical protein